jgi:hypothetical protein
MENKKANKVPNKSRMRQHLLRERTRKLVKRHCITDVLLSLGVFTKTRTEAPQTTQGIADLVRIRTNCRESASPNSVRGPAESLRSLQDLRVRKVLFLECLLELFLVELFQVPDHEGGSLAIDVHAH